MTTKFSKKKEALSILKIVFKSSHLEDALWQKARLANTVRSIHEPQTEKKILFPFKATKNREFCPNKECFFPENAKKA